MRHTWPKVWPIVDWNNRGVASHDWTWSQNLVYNMHSCESWGRVILSDRTVIQLPDAQLEEAYGFVPPPPAEGTPKPGSMARIPGGLYTIGPDEAIFITVVDPDGDATRAGNEGGVFSSEDYTVYLRLTANDGSQNGQTRSSMFFSWPWVRMPSMATTCSSVSSR